MFGFYLICILHTELEFSSSLVFCKVEQRWLESLTDLQPLQIITRGLTFSLHHLHFLPSTLAPPSPTTVLAFFCYVLWLHFTLSQSPQWSFHFRAEPCSHLGYWNTPLAMLRMHSGAYFRIINGCVHVSQPMHVCESTVMQALITHTGILISFLHTLAWLYFLSVLAWKGRHIGFSFHFDWCSFILIRNSLNLIAFCMRHCIVVIMSVLLIPPTPNIWPKMPNTLL